MRNPLCLATCLLTVPLLLVAGCQPYQSPAADSSNVTGGAAHSANQSARGAKGTLAASDSPPASDQPAGDQPASDQPQSDQLASGQPAGDANLQARTTQDTTADERPSPGSAPTRVATTDSAGQATGTKTGGDKKSFPTIEDDGVTSVTFDHLELDVPADIVIKPSMLTSFVKQLDHHKIRIKGFIHAGTVFSQSGIKEFLLLKNTECPFGPGGQAHHIIKVTIPQGEGISYTTRALTVEGKFAVKPWEGGDGNTWLIYEMSGQVVN